MENIIWKDIPGYIGLYQASSNGEIKSLNRSKLGKRKCLSFVRERILAKAKSVNGYYLSHLSKDGKAKLFFTHRLIAMAFLQPDILGETINHINGIKTDNRISNIEIMSIQENISHAVLTGLRCSAGEKNPKSKITEKQIVEIRSLHKTGASYAWIAKKYNVKELCIYRICKYITWKNVA